jgi:WD repeat-containing protein 45
VNYNQDNECFVVSTSAGLRVFCTEEFRVTFIRDFFGGIKMAELLFCTNIIGFVGTGENPCYPSTRFIFWDDVKLMPIGEFDFKTDVLNIKLRRDYVVLLLEEKIYVYLLNDFKRVDQFVTISNPQGLVALSPNMPDSNACVLAFPEKPAGRVGIVDFSRGKDNPQKAYVDAHTDELAQIKLSQDGTIMATCSGKGTFIRIWDTKKAEMLQELCRSTFAANISDLTIDRSNMMLACASDQGTIHKFKLSGDNTKSSMAGLSSLSSYFGTGVPFSVYGEN